jgi:hypothetical protein
MKKLIDLNGVHRDEVDELNERLEEECWKHTELTNDESNALISLINYVIDHRVNERACSISYTDLINLKNKLYI